MVQRPRSGGYKIPPILALSQLSNALPVNQSKFYISIVTPSISHFRFFLFLIFISDQQPRRIRQMLTNNNVCSLSLDGSPSTVYERLFHPSCMHYIHTNIQTYVHLHLQHLIYCTLDFFSLASIIIRQLFAGFTVEP